MQLFPKEKKLEKQILTSTFHLVLAILSVVNFAVPSAMASELTAKDIMVKVDERYTGDSSIVESFMILIDRKGNQRVRQTKSYSKEYGEDTKSISFFVSPADVKNTAFLSYDWDNEKKEDESWLYLPALRKVKRIPSSNKSDAFMGSDFTYADIEGVEVEDYNHQMVNENEKLDGHDVWVIASTPKKAIRRKVIKKTGYLKSQFWVRKDIFMIVKGKFWVKKGKKIKYLNVLDIKKIDKIWTAQKFQMITTKKKKTEHGTIMQVNSIIYNQGVSDNLFSTQRMERGL